MSIGCDSGSGCDFYTESCHRSRRLRRCIETRYPIEPGERYVAIRGLSDGDFWSLTQSLKGYHLCRALHQAFRVTNRDDKYLMAEGCVIAFGELRAVDESDLGYFAREGAPERDLFRRALVWAGALPSDGIDEPTEEDWSTISRLSWEYYPRQCVPFDALGNPFALEHSEMTS